MVVVVVEDGCDLEVVMIAAIENSLAAVTRTTLEEL